MMVSIFKWFLRQQFPAVALALLLAATLSFGQAQPSPSPGTTSRQITGEVKLDGKPAPAGVSIELQIVFTGDPKTSGSEVGRTTTNAQGKFAFDHLELVGKNQGRNFFAVSTIQPGFEGAIQVVDLTNETHGEAVLNLRRSAEASSGSSDQTSTSGAPAQTPRFSSNQKAQEAFAQAQELLFKKNDPQGSIELFKKTVKLDPWFGPGYMLLGLANTQLQRWGDAQYAFEEATKVEPGNAQAYLGVGAALNEQHEYAAAMKPLQHSLDLKPDSAEAHYELARSLASMDKWDEAAPHAQRAIDINPEYAGPHVLMGNIYVKNGEAEAALHEFEEYLRLDPKGSLAPSVKQMIAQLRQALAR